MKLETIGKTIRAARLARGLTQDRLAMMAGISRGTLNGLEAGMVKELGFRKLDRILNILGYDLEAEAIPHPPGLASERTGVLSLRGNRAGVALWAPTVGRFRFLLRPPARQGPAGGVHENSLLVR